jgi:GntR family transcriptional regulator of arabinose operon
MIKSGELTALFAVNDRKGLELINKLMGMGIRIPEDVSVIGFDDYEASSLARIPMSTVRQHFEEEGYTAAKILLGAIEGSDSQFNKIRIGTKLIIRSSTEILQYK